MSLLKKKKKEEEEISSKQVWQSCIFSIKEAFASWRGVALARIFMFVATGAVTAFQSTYYIKLLVGYIEEHKPFHFIVLLVFGFFVLGLVAEFFDIMLSAREDTARVRFEQRINRRIFKKAANVELSCYENAAFYNKYTRALDNTSTRMINVFYGFSWVSVEVIKLVFYLAVMISVDAGVGIFLIFPIVGNFVFGRWLNSIEQKRYKEDTKNARVIDYVLRVLHLGQYAKDMRITNAYSMVQNKHKEAVSASLKIWDKFAFKSGTVYWVKVQFTFLMIFEGILAYCSYRALVGGTISLAEMTIMTSVMTAAANEIIWVFNNIVEIRNECVYIQNAREFLAYEEKIPEDGGGIPAPDVIESIEFRGVTFKYEGAEDAAVKELSFKVSGGERIALVGHNGAGKSTVVKLLLRMYDPSEGIILLNGRNLRAYEVRSLRNMFSAAFQDHKVLAMSVLDNIVMGADIADGAKRAADALKKVGLWDKISRLEHGINTVMTKEFDDAGAVLSGGQYQKLAVARALVQNGRCMVFDEPSSALDPIAEYDLFNTIMEETDDKTVFLISHRLSSVKAADRIFMFENGRLIESGTHDALMKKDGAYADMFMHQARSYLAYDEDGKEDGAI